MVMATFRFYGQLNGFLTHARRGHAFAADCARAATTKHMIEALGVPHTEVELILVNGESGSLELLLEENDRVAVYPKFESFDVRAVQRVRVPASARPRFVADAHLGGLARLLRMAGFDTLYDNGFPDDEIERLSIDEDRVVLTRDRELLKRRGILDGCYVHALKSADQLRELFDRLDLPGLVRPFTLCLHCNAPLREVGKEAVFDRLPPMVRNGQDEFSTCDCCRRIYWKGSHWQRMSALLAALSHA
jgi:uncharacterized protein with PIN domain